MIRMVAVAVLISVTAVAQAQTKQGAKPIPQMGMGILALESDTEGRLFVDGREKLALSPGTTSTLNLTAGQHFIELRNASGTKLWQEIVDVPADRQVAKRIEAARKQEPVRPSPPAPELEAWEELGLLDRTLAGLRCQFDQKCDGVVDVNAEEVRRYCVDSASTAKPITPSVQTNGPQGEALQARIHRLRRKVAAIDDNACAEPLYYRGEFERALGKIGPVIEDMERFKVTEDTWGFDGIAKAYVLRGLIENALLDRKAVLQDLSVALDYFSANRKQIGDLAARGDPLAAELLRMPDAFVMKARLYRSVVLYRMGRYTEALADYNNFTAIETTIAGLKDPTGDKLGEIIRRHVQEQGANNGDLTTLPAASRTIPDGAAGHASPNIHPSIAPAGETDIRHEIDVIANAGQYAPLPEDHIGMASHSNSTTATRIIRNDTSFALHLLMSGPVDRRIDLPAGGSTAVEFPPGSYRVAARVDSSSVRPFYGVQVLAAGVEYTSQFYIK